MPKLICVVMGQDCEQTIGMCLDSVKDADAIVYLDGGSTDDTKDIVTHFDVDHYVDEDDPKFISDEKALIRLENEFDKSDPNMISKQRNFYLDYLKKNFMGDICLVLDADEVVDDLSEYMKWKKTEDDFIQSPVMKHLMYNLAYEDATRDFHLVSNRFFKITKDLFYPEGEHTVLSCTNPRNDGPCVKGLIWHLGYLGGVWDVKKRYDQQKLRDNGHTPEFLDSWNKTHMLGKYPVKPINPVELPKVILENFGIDRDELYFANRGLEINHFIDAIHWKQRFNPKDAIEFGCGRGPRVYAMEGVGIKALGVELSEYAVKNKLIPFVKQGDVLNYNRGVFDLVIAYDLLEHINYEDLDKAINTLIKHSDKNILVSVPVLGDPNLEADPTHIIKETKEWWVKQFVSKGLKEVEVPEHFLFREQLMIFEKLPSEWEKTDYDISKKIGVGANIK